MEDTLKRHRDQLEVVIRERTASLVKANEQLQNEIGERRDAQAEIQRLNLGLEQRVKERTSELEKAYEDLRELDRMKDVFLSTISHEFRTPLTSIRSYSEVLINYEEERETQKDFLGIIKSESERLSRLIDNILDLSQIEAGGMVWNDAPTSIGEVIERAACAESQLLHERSLQLSLGIAPNLPVVKVDFDRIQQVITNLLGNAIKFSPRGGEISIWAERISGGTGGGPGEWIRVSVTDQGKGIGDEDREIIFERFRQASSDTLTDKPKGTGLGLPICREIISHYGGELWVESRGGEGSTFSFTVPVSGDDRSTGATSSKKHGATTGSVRMSATDRLR